MEFRLGAQVVYGPDGKLLTDTYGKYLEVLALHPLFIFKIGFLQSEKGKIYR
jgi:hypothetical protein